MRTISRRAFIGAASLVTLGRVGDKRLLADDLASVQQGGRLTSPWAREIEDILLRVRPPVFASRIARVTEFGGRGDGTTDCRPAFQQAIDQLNAQGGEHLVVPTGMWQLNGPLHLKSNVHLHLEDSATLQFSPDPDLYLPVVMTRWEGTELYNHSPLIYAYQAINVAVTGKGTLRGNGAEVFASWREKQAADQQLLRKMGLEGAPVHERVFGKGHFLRPSMMQFFACRNVLVDGPTIVDLPFWGMHLVYSQNVTLRNVRVDSPRINNDGVDPESSTDVLIENCVFNTGDDCVAIKSGRDQDGWRVGRPSESLVIRDCEMSGTTAFGAGVAIGSEMSGGVRNIYIDRCRMKTVPAALNFKTNLDRGGAIEHIRVNDVSVDKCKTLVQFTTAFAGYRGGHHPPAFRDFNLQDVACRDADVAISAIGVPDAPLREVSIRRMTVRASSKPFDIRYVRDFGLDDIRINGERVSVACNID